MTPGQTILVPTHGGIEEATILRIRDNMITYRQLLGQHGYAIAEGRVRVCDRGITWAAGWREDEAVAFRVARALQ